VSVSSTPAAGVGVSFPLPPEEQARADAYALLAHLYSGPPDAALLRALGAGPRLAESAGAWPAAYNRLADASTVMDTDAADQEYTDLFVGVGRSPVELHASHWLAHESNRPLADLRTVLAGLRIGRRDDAMLLEDHLGALLETMRLLIGGAPGFAPSGIAAQRTFFARWIDPWTTDCCDAIEASSIANYYRRVAECTKVFLAIERDSIALE
jgi:TorA maturation chaperone TorD